MLCFGVLLFFSSLTKYKFSIFCFLFPVLRPHFLSHRVYPASICLPYSGNVFTFALYILDFSTGSILFYPKTIFSVLKFPLTFTMSYLIFKPSSLLPQLIVFSQRQNYFMLIWAWQSLKGSSCNPASKWFCFRNMFLLGVLDSFTLPFYVLHFSN